MRVFTIIILSQICICDSFMLNTPKKSLSHQKKYVNIKSRLLTSSENNDNSSEDDIPIELRKEIEKQLEEGSLPDWQVRLKIMGFTPLTYFGFGLAFVILSLNAGLGTGWASRVLGMDDGGSIRIERPDKKIGYREPVDDPFPFRNKL